MAKDSDVIDIKTRGQAFEEVDLGEFIEVKAGELYDLADKLENLLSEHPECGVYQRGGFLVEISTVPMDTKGVIERKKNSHVITDVATARLRELGSRYSHWRKYDNRSNKLKRVDCPRDVAETLSARNSWKIPVLSAVLGSPTILRNGDIISEPGYNKETGIFLHINEWKKLKKQKPTQQEAIKAREFIEDAVGEFPFVDEANRSTWVAALLTSLIRWDLRSAPFFGFDAPTAGSGKSLLAELIGYLVNGVYPPALNKPKNDEEIRKSLLSVLMAGDSVLLIDNISYAISGDELCSIATSEYYRDRVLGQNRLVTVSTKSTIMMTGNNLVVKGDLTRRILISRLDPEVEKPEDRVFKRDVRKYVADNRQLIVNAALTILRAYALANRPDMKLSSFGSFEEWTHCVRAPLVWAGGTDPCETLKRVQKSDPEREQLSSFLNIWYDIYGEEDVMVRTFTGEISSQGTENLDEKVTNDQRIALKDALLSIAGDGNKVNSRRLGRKILAWEGRVCNNLKITFSPVTLNSRAFRLRIAEPGKPVGYSVLSVTDIANAENGRKVTVSEETTKPTDTNRPTDPKVLKAVTNACDGLQLTPEQFLNQLAPEDINDIELDAVDAKTLRAMASHFNQKLKEGNLDE